MSMKDDFFKPEAERLGLFDKGREEPTQLGQAVLLPVNDQVDMADQYTTSILLSRAFKKVHCNLVMKIDDVIYEDRVPRSELMETTYFNTHDSPRRQFVITPAGVAGIAGSYKVRTSIPDPQVVADMTYHTLDELKLLSEHERIPQDFKVKERQPGKIEPVIPVNRILGTIAVTQGLGKRHSDVLGKIRTVTGRGQMRKRDVDNTQKYMGKNKTPRTEYFLNSQATRDLLVAYKWTPDSEVHDRYLHHYFTELINGPVKVEMGPDERDFKSPNQEEVVREEEPGVIKEATKEEIKEFIEEATKEEIEEDISEAIDTWAESAAASVKTAEPPAWHQEAEHPIPPIDSTALRDEALHILKTELEIAKAMGVPKNRVLEDIVINIKNQTGLDYRHLLQELPEDICDIKEKKMLSVIDLGKLTGRSSQDISHLLEEYGFQKLDDKGIFRPTHKGERFSEKHDFLHHGHLAWQWKWDVDMVKGLIEHSTYQET